MEIFSKVMPRANIQTTLIYVHLITISKIIHSETISDLLLLDSSEALTSMGRATLDPVCRKLPVYNRDYI